MARSRLSGRSRMLSGFAASARRLAMAELPEELFVASIEALVRQDHEWVPREAEKTLYLRPFMFSTEIGLGVKPADSYEYLLIASPAGAYRPKGLKPVSVWLSDDYVRAAPGGTGEAKCAGNYAASLIAQAEASSTVAIRLCGWTLPNAGGLKKWAG